jgi:hypothetical protein
MGKLRKLRRQIERNPEEWMYKSEWFKKWEPERPYIPLYAIGGWKGSSMKGDKPFMPSLRTMWLSAHNRYPHPYQRFVRRVLKDLGYNVY